MRFAMLIIVLCSLLASSGCADKIVDLGANGKFHVHQAKCTEGACGVLLHSADDGHHDNLAYYQLDGPEHCGLQNFSGRSPKGLVIERGKCYFQAAPCGT